MTRTLRATNPRLSLSPRRGVASLALAMTFMLVVFSMLLAFTLDLTADHLRVGNAWAADQALYAAEGGLDVALQAGAARAVTGPCGRGRYAAVARGGRLTSLGEVELPSGARIRRAVTVQVGGGRPVRGSWRQVPAAGVPDRIRMLEAAEPR